MLNGGSRRCSIASKRVVWGLLEVLVYLAIENIEPDPTALYGLEKSAKHKLDCWYKLRNRMAFGGVHLVWIFGRAHR